MIRSLKDWSSSTPTNCGLCFLEPFADCTATSYIWPMLEFSVVMLPKKQEVMGSVGQPLPLASMLENGKAGSLAWSWRERDLFSYIWAKTLNPKRMDDSFRNHRWFWKPSKELAKTVGCVLSGWMVLSANVVCATRMHAFCHLPHFWTDDRKYAQIGDLECTMIVLRFSNLHCYVHLFIPGLSVQIITTDGKILKDVRRADAH